MVEQVAGVFYVALVVARLVGLTVVARPRVPDRVTSGQPQPNSLAISPLRATSGRRVGVRVEVDHRGQEVVDLVWS